MTDDSIRKTLIFLRLAWVAVMLGVAAFATVIAFVIDGERDGPWSGSLGQVLFYVAVGLFLLLTPIAYFFRMQIYKANWIGDVVTPPGYKVGTLIVLAALELTAWVGLGSCLASQTWWPGVLPAIAAMILHVFNYPTGKPMHPIDSRSG